jgi:hypothetical protein
LERRRIRATRAAGDPATAVGWGSVWMLTLQPPFRATRACARRPSSSRRAHYRFARHDGTGSPAAAFAAQSVSQWPAQLFAARAPNCQ